MDNRFNLIDENWIPVVGRGLVSLRAIFSDNSLCLLGGNPVKKIAVMKLLCAIGQAAATPADEHEWREMGVTGFSERCLAYLDKWHDRFYLRGSQPFLQMSLPDTCKNQVYGAFILGKAVANTTVLNHGQITELPSLEEQALILIGQMSMSLGGKKCDNSIVLTHGYMGKSKTAKYGPGVGFMGLLHTFLIGENLIESVWLNLISLEQISQEPVFEQGIGVAPWEKMPVGEDCETARALKVSLMGRLIPLSRFILLGDEHIKITEGIHHGGHKDGICDPTVSVYRSDKEVKAILANPSKKPWRELASILSFIDSTGSKGADTMQVRCALPRLPHLSGSFAVWSGGIRVTNTSGEQYTSGKDGFVESCVWLDSEVLGESGFTILKSEMDQLGVVAKILYGSVIGYYKKLNAIGDNRAARSSEKFWEYCERDFKELLINCRIGDDEMVNRSKLRRRFAAYTHASFDFMCGKETARQIEAWAEYRPRLGKYLSKDQ